MIVKYTKHYLNKLEDIFAESEYILRYEKGNFKSGWCVLEDKNVIIINKFFDLNAKINCLLDIIANVDINEDDLSEKNKKIYRELSQKGGQVQLGL